MGNDNLFRSDIFVNTIATLISQEIEIYNTNGAIGAARAVGLHDGDFDKFGAYIMNNDYVTKFKPSTNNASYVAAYKKWKKELELTIVK